MERARQGLFRKCEMRTGSQHDPAQRLGETDTKLVIQGLPLFSRNQTARLSAPRRRGRRLPDVVSKMRARKTVRLPGDWRCGIIKTDEGPLEDGVGLSGVGVAQQF